MKQTIRSTYALDGADRVAGIAPCKDCKERYQSCWGSCDKYQAWKQKRSEFIKERYIESYEEAAFINVRRYGMEKAILKRGDKVRTGGR